MRLLVLLGSLLWAGVTLARPRRGGARQGGGSDLRGLVMVHTAAADIGGDPTLGVLLALWWGVVESLAD